MANLFLQTVFFPRLCPANSVLVPVSWGAQFCCDGVSVFSGHVSPVCIEQLTTLLNIYLIMKIGKKFTRFDETFQTRRNIISVLI